MNDLEIIMHNVKAHDRVAKTYDFNHPEIFNDTEQNRLKNVIAWAIDQVSTGSNICKAMDFGAGTGNLTKYLLDMGAEVCAADISTKCLEEIKNKFSDNHCLSIYKLNGRDLIGIKANEFDLLVLYSVLHHIPDYLSVLPEFIRVLKPGGILLIEHEVTEGFWLNRPSYNKYLAEINIDFLFNHYAEIAVMPTQFDKIKRLTSKISRIFNIASWKAVLTRNRNVGKIDTDEGDIHVTKVDHVDWVQIKNKLEGSCTIIKDEDYLVCREANQSPRAWKRWHNKTSDMKLFVAMKLK